jgi:predicted nucleic acid-binding protein
MQRAIASREIALPPVVVAEALSKPDIDPALVRLITWFDVLPIAPGYWERAGYLRGSLLRLKLKAQLADTLIAQSCIDRGIPLITYDDDFRHFVRAGLQLL